MMSDLRLRWLAIVMLACITLPAAARPLAEIRERGVLSMCANPDALPHASQKADPPGFQIEIGRAIAGAMKLQLHVDWIIPRLRAGLVDCDMLMDTIVDPVAQRGPIKLTRAYQKSGVALALGKGNEAARRFQDLPAGTRVGVMINSLASRQLNQQGLYTVPYAFEPDMVEDVANGSIAGCAVSPATIAYYIHSHPGTPLRYVHAYDSEPDLRWDLAVGLRRSDDALVEAVNKALASLMQDGTLARIYGRYGVEYRQP
jgi:ABC-type amino acid transport substrate-binding protein